MPQTTFFAIPATPTTVLSHAACCARDNKYNSQTGRFVHGCHEEPTLMPCCWSSISATPISASQPRGPAGKAFRCTHGRVLQP
ncbi:hypothetical protein N656DRAFT_375776 [Canariomyces notabilis]|uniref:Uncharacterized protein n=1 Tax=Canariomyces notabilis TaxID=2074819 RepID=A0AAN6QEP0_9PEZI|nr:hypothetical protein N656DRAFT_375776 [Canariomyces arenarius]